VRLISVIHLVDGGIIEVALVVLIVLKIAPVLELAVIIF
jgi:hypothetical protein